MAGTSAHLLMGSSASFSQRFTSSGEGSKLKLCLFCLNPADSVNERAANGTDWTKSCFNQFLWKYLLGDDMVKITDFTGNHLKTAVPPLCSSCHQKCMQLATYHLEFEKIQNEIMEVSKDLLEGWKQKDTLLSKEEYEMAVQNASKEKGRSKAPANRFIKSPTNQNQKAFPSYESVQMYQILRNPGHVRIPLSCLKSFGFTEIKNLMGKNSSIANHIIGGSKLQKSPQSSPSSVALIVEKAKSKAAAVMVAAAAAAQAQAMKNSMPKMIPMPLLPNPTPKRYWINDVQVEMLTGNEGSSSNPNSDEDGYEQEEDVDEEEEYIHNQGAPQRKPNIPMNSNTSRGNYVMKALKLPPLNNIKRQKMTIPMEQEVDEYYDEEEEGDNENYVQMVNKEEQNYDEDEILDYSNEESRQFFDEETGEVLYEDDDNGSYEDDYGDGSAQYYNNGSSSNLELDLVNQRGNPKKRKRVFVLRKGNWTADEDQMISQIVTQEGPKNWSKVALQLGTGRTGKQIRERWTHHLNPEVNKEPWSEQEDVVLMEAHARWGNQWSRISKLLPGRTDNAVKNHWNGTLKRKAQLMQYNGTNNSSVKAEYGENSEDGDY